MTTLTTRLENASLIPLKKNFQTVDTKIPGIDSNPKQANSDKCQLFFIDATPIVNKKSFSAFDELIASLEDNEEFSNANKWVAEKFYNDGTTLASLRLSAGMTQTKLAKICGVKQSHISRYESGNCEPSISMSKTMAEAMGISLDLFFEAWSNTRNSLDTEIEK